MGGGIPIAQVYLRSNYQIAMSFSFFNGVTRTLIEAGFAEIVISSPVAGLRPLRFFVAGRFTLLILSKPGRVTSPIARFLI